MAKIRLLIVDDSSEYRREIISGVEDYCDVVGEANDGLEAIKLIEETKPDIVLLDIVMPNMDGFGVLDYTRKMAERPNIIIVSELASESFISRAMNGGAAYYMLKPVSIDMLKKRIDDVMEGRRENMVVTHGMEEKIANIFLSVGIPAHIKGYQFLREAIKMTIEEPEIINSITKRLYPSIANRFNTSSSKVERAIRHAIEVAWARGKIENINSIFGIKVYTTNEKPTNGEFIALVADKMLIESAS